MTDQIITNTIHTGDAFDILPTLPENSVHAVVTDPPYGLAFMGRDWDDFEPKEYQEWCEDWAREAMRVLRPGGHLLAFSGNRTHHRLFTGVEDAGFEVRDTVTWHYGSGFPKALDVGKAIDKQAGAEREVVGEYQYPDGKDRDIESHKQEWMHYGETNGLDRHKETAPATDEAARWDGFKTCLKPATEYVIVARKPLDGDTVAGNVLEWGTGALNIGETRIGDEERTTKGAKGTTTTMQSGSLSDGSGGELEFTHEGRYPSNVVFHEDTAQDLDQQVGDTSSGGGQSRDGDATASTRYTENGSTDFAAEPGQRRGDSGGPSRYFYTSKASKSERTNDGQIQNDHPTVKPLDLMQWLVKLTTREGQIVLDPFCGSGTTLKAAKSVGREFVGVERQAEYADVARARCGLSPRDASNVRGDDNQRGLGAFED